jgi:hypothetical protein
VGALAEAVVGVVRVDQAPLHAGGAPLGEQGVGVVDVEVDGREGGQRVEAVDLRQVEVDLVPLGVRVRGTAS